MPSQDVNEITRKIIGCAFEVSNALGVGFVEKVYENALTHALLKSGSTVAQQHSIIEELIRPAYSSVFICG